MALPEKFESDLDTVSTTCGSGWVRRRHFRNINKSSMGLASKVQNILGSGQYHLR